MGASGLDGEGVGWGVVRQYHNQKGTEGGGGGDSRLVGSLGLGDFTDNKNILHAILWTLLFKSP